MKILLAIYVGGAFVYVIGAAGDIGSAHQLGTWFAAMFNQLANSFLWPVWLLMTLMGK